MYPSIDVRVCKPYSTYSTIALLCFIIGNTYEEIIKSAIALKRAHKSHKLVRINLAKFHRQIYTIYGYIHTNALKF